MTQGQASKDQHRLKEKIQKKKYKLQKKEKLKKKKQGLIEGDNNVLSQRLVDKL